MTSRPAREIVREGALLRMGWALAPALVGLRMIAIAIKVAIVCAILGAVCLGALWLHYALTQPEQAGLAWTLGLLTAAVALPTNRSLRTRVLLLLAASLFIAAAIYTAF